MANYTSFAEHTFQVARQSGDEFTVLCIFHDDTNASMQFNIRSGLFICWSCGARGSLKKIQQQLGIVGDIDSTPDLDELKKRIAELSNDDDRPGILSENVLKRYTFPTDYWSKNRGFTDEAIRTFQLGYDPMENHAIIPVRDINDKLISLIRRDLDPDAFIRYKNAKRFPRKHTLFGAWLVAKYQTNYVVVTEGPLDAVSVWSAGIPAVAQFGSSLSEEQVQLLRQLGLDKIVLFYDNDKSGRQATEQAIELLRGNFLVHRVKYNRADGKDPGELSRASIERRVDNAVWIK